MHSDQKTLAQTCLQAADRGTLSFPEIVGALTEGGFESYSVDFRRGVASYYLPSGESVELATHTDTLPVAPTFDTEALGGAIREAQTLATGYTYRGFCEKAKRAGCAGYMVSLTGRRALYFGRTAETHVELFPDRP